MMKVAGTSWSKSLTFSISKNALNAFKETFTLIHNTEIKKIDIKTRKPLKMTGGKLGLPLLLFLQNE